jgi:hypothetical protein
MKKVWLFIAVIPLLVGCAAVEVKKVTSESQEGIRFYRPHPYLLVTMGVPPVVATDQTVTPKPSESGQSPGPTSKPGQTPGATKTKVKGPATPPTEPGKSDAQSTSKPDQIYVQLIWLPDKNENYSIMTKSGLGTVNTSFTLKDGWELVQFGGNVDTKIPETLTAVTGFLTAAVQAPAALMKAIPGPPGAKQYIQPGLYRLEFENGLVNKIVGPLPLGSL